MQTSKKMYNVGLSAYKQSEKALNAELELDPFFNADFHLKMLSTFICHIARCVANIALALWCIPTTFVRVFTEADSGKAITRGFIAAGHHLGAALIDFINIFATAGALIARSIFSVAGYEKKDGLINGLDNCANSLKAQEQYEAASALNFGS